MIDLKQLREDPERFLKGAQEKKMTVDIDTLLELDRQIRELTTEREALTSEKNKIGKDIGQLAGKLKKPMTKKLRRCRHR